MTRTARLAAILAAAVLLLGAARAAAGTITVRGSARIQAGAPVTLADIATLQGDDAAAFGALVVVEDPSALPRSGAGRRIDLAIVRRALDQAGARWGRLALGGGDCAVLVAEPAPIVEEPAPVADLVPEAPPDEPAPIDLSGPRTVRTCIVEWIATLTGAALPDLRISFERGEEALLAMEAAGRRVDVQPGTRGGSGRMPVRIWVYEGDRIVAEGAVRAEVRVRRAAVTIIPSVRRGDILAPEMLSEQEMWLEPTLGAPVASVGDAVGMSMATRLDAGSVLYAQHVEQPIAVRRGELVTVHCVSGGVVVKTPARAQADGRIGETIEMRLDSSRRSFLARVQGPGVAVIALGARVEANP